MGTAAPRRPPTGSPRRDLLGAESRHQTIRRHCAHEATPDGFFGVAGLRTRFRRHAAARQTLESADPRPGEVHGDHPQRNRPGHQLRRHGLRLPGQREGRRRGSEGRLPRARAPRHEAAGLPHAQDRGLRQVPGHAARAAADRLSGRLPAACDERRRVREGAAPRTPRQDGGGTRRRPHPAHRLLVPRHPAGVQEHRRRIRLGPVPDPVQLHGHLPAGGHRGA